MADLAADANRVAGLDVDVIAVPNRLFGPGITVSGLLAGRDIAAALAGRDDLSCLLLPPNCINADGVTLDDLTVDDLKQQLRTAVVPGRYDLAGALKACAAAARHGDTGKRPR